MDATMYIFINKGLGMSTGKAAAQAAHAAVEAFRKSDPTLVDAWLLGGHYKKLVMEADDSDELANVGGYLDDRGFTPEWIYDEGLTEFDGRMRHTAIGVPIVDKDDPNVAATFSTFRLYKDKSDAGMLQAGMVTADNIQDGTITADNLMRQTSPVPADVRVVNVTASAGPARRRLADGLSKLRAWG